MQLLMTSQLIVALDYCDKAHAYTVIKHLDPASCVLKIGSEMFTLFGPEFVRELVKQGYKIFLDLKFHDIPNTVAQSCRSAAELGVWMMNVHASGGFAMMLAAREALASYAERPLLIAVTVLTSMSASELPAIGLESDVETQVGRLSQLAYQAGLDGVVCSAHEVPLVKSLCGNDFLTITPGIRLLGDALGDQSRVMTPVQANAYGSDYLVIGRSITQATQPKVVIASILQSLET